MKSAHQKKKKKRQSEEKRSRFSYYVSTTGSYFSAGLPPRLIFHSSKSCGSKSFTNTENRCIELQLTRFQKKTLFRHFSTRRQAFQLDAVYLEAEDLSAGERGGRRCASTPESNRRIEQKFFSLVVLAWPQQRGQTRDRLKCEYEDVVLKICGFTFVRHNELSKSSGELIFGCPYHSYFCPTGKS